MPGSRGIFTYLIGVDASAELDPATEERLQSVLEGGHSGAAADENNVRDVTDSQRRVLKHGRHRVDAPVTKTRVVGGWVYAREARKEQKRIRRRQHVCGWIDDCSSRLCGRTLAPTDGGHAFLIVPACNTPVHPPTALVVSCSDVCSCNRVRERLLRQQMEAF